jgi:hypothetical protein
MEQDKADGEDYREQERKAEADRHVTAMQPLKNSIADMVALPLEDQAHLMFSTIAHAATECMTEATVLRAREEEPAEPQHPRSRSRQSRVREERRYAELHHLARLSEAGSRLLDAYTRLNSQNGQLASHYIHRKRQDDGSFVETRLVHRAPAPASALALVPSNEEQAAPPPSARN